MLGYTLVIRTALKETRKKRKSPSSLFKFYGAAGRGRRKRGTAGEKKNRGPVGGGGGGEIWTDELPKSPQRATLEQRRKKKAKRYPPIRLTAVRVESEQ